MIASCAHFCYESVSQATAVAPRGKANMRADRRFTAEDESAVGVEGIAQVESLMDASVALLCGETGDADDEVLGRAVLVRARSKLSRLRALAEEASGDLRPSRRIA